MRVISIQWFKEEYLDFVCHENSLTLEWHYHKFGFCILLLVLWPQIIYLNFFSQFPHMLYKDDTYFISRSNMRKYETRSIKYLIHYVLQSRYLIHVSCPSFKLVDRRDFYLNYIMYSYGVATVILLLLFSPNSSSIYFLFLKGMAFL